MRVRTLNFRVSPFKPSLYRTSPLPQPSLRHVSPFLVLTSLCISFLGHHFVTRLATSLSLPGLVHDFLTPAKHCPRRSLPPPRLACATPLYASHLSLARCASLCHCPTMSRLSLASGHAKQPKTFCFYFF